MASSTHAKLVEYDASENAVYHEFFTEPLIFNNGNIAVQDLPGLAVELKQEILENYAI